MSRKASKSVAPPIELKHATIIEMENGFMCFFCSPLNQSEAELKELVALTVEDVMVELEKFWPEEK